MNKKNKITALKIPKILKEVKFSPLAIEILKKLKQSGFQGYLVGGCVRDSLVGIKAKDFDISTDATPEEIRKIFRSSRIIGKRFRLVHVFSKNELIEVSTFRANTSRKDNDSGVIKDSEGKILIILNHPSEIVKRSIRNLKKIKLISADQLNVFDLLNAKSLVIGEDALSTI